MEHRRQNSNMDGGYGWVIVFASFAAQFLVGGILFSFGLFFVEISNEFSTSGKSEISLIASILIALTGIIGPIASALVNKFGCRFVSILGSVVAALGFGLAYFVTNVMSLYLTIGLAGGIGLGLLYFPSLVIVHQYFSKRRATAIGICVCGSGLGTFSFQWIFGLLLNQFSWRSVFLVISGIILASSILGILYRPLQQNQSSDDAQNQGLTRNLTSPVTLSASVAPPLKQPLGKKLSQILRKSVDIPLLQNPLFIVFILCDAMGSFGYSVPYIYLPELGRNYELAGQSSTLLGIVAVTNVPSRLISGYLSDKPWANRLLLYNGCVIMIGAGLILSPHLSSLIELQGYAGVFGVNVGVYHSLKTVVLVDLIGAEKFSDAFGITLFISSVALIFGPPIVGLLFDVHGSYHYGFYWTGGVVLSSGVLMLVLIPIIRKFQRNKSKLLEKLRKIELGAGLA